MRASHERFPSAPGALHSKAVGPFAEFMKDHPALTQWKENYYFLPRDVAVFIPGMPPKGGALLPADGAIPIDTTMVECLQHLGATAGQASVSTPAAGSSGDPAQGGQAVPAAGAGAKRLAKPSAVEPVLKPPEQLEANIRSQQADPNFTFEFNWPGRTAAAKSKQTKCNFDVPFTIKEGCSGYDNNDYLYGWQSKFFYQQLIEYKEKSYLLPADAERLRATRRYSSNNCWPGESYEKRCRDQMAGEYVPPPSYKRILWDTTGIGWPTFQLLDINTLRPPRTSDLLIPLWCRFFLICRDRTVFKENATVADRIDWSRTKFKVFKEKHYCVRVSLPLHVQQETRSKIQSEQWETFSHGTKVYCLHAILEAGFLFPSNRKYGGGTKQKGKGGRECIGVYSHLLEDVDDPYPHTKYSTGEETFQDQQWWSAEIIFASPQKTVTKIPASGGHDQWCHETVDYQYQTGTPPCGHDRYPGDPRVRLESDCSSSGGNIGPYAAQIRAG